MYLMFQIKVEIFIWIIGFDIPFHFIGESSGSAEPSVIPPPDGSLYLDNFRYKAFPDF